MRRRCYRHSAVASNGVLLSWTARANRRHDGFQTGLDRIALIEKTNTGYETYGVVLVYSGGLRWRLSVYIRHLALHLVVAV